MTKPKSAEIHHLHGNPSNLPNVEKRDVQPDPIAPAPPNWLSKRGREMWTFIAPELERNALLTKRDRESFGFLCEEAAVAKETLLRIRDPKNGYGDVLDADSAHAGRLRRHPAWIVYTQARTGFLQLAKEFGLTPSSRIGLLLSPTGAVTPRGADDDDDEVSFG